MFKYLTAAGETKCSETYALQQNCQLEVDDECLYIWSRNRYICY